MTRFVFMLGLALTAATPVAGEEPGAAPQPAAPSTPQAAPARRPLDLRVFTNIDKPITGLWDLEIPDMTSRRVEIRETQPGLSKSLVGIDTSTGEEILTLTVKREGIGYEGAINKALAPCGFETLPVREFLPLGDAIVLRFDASPTSSPCPMMEGGHAGRFQVRSARGGPVRLRAFSEIASVNVRETYGIGGDRDRAETTYAHPFDSVSIEPGSEVLLLQRVKAPLDGSYWFEVEALVSPAPGIEPPRGYLQGDSLLFQGSLNLRRVKPPSGASGP
ncbi:MAG TPA: hypothetical protein VFG76_08465 [Candidatus Polarisedimenticolia bacterium]|nr:hypothetical protein [Candidatus Polarisedimenticolia bacterium]